MKTFEEILKTARMKYKDAVRGKEYQEELLKQENLTVIAYEALLKRKSVYVQDIALLEYIFGTWFLQSEQIVLSNESKTEKPKPIFRIGQKVWYVDDFYCTPDIRVLRCTIENKDCCKLRLITDRNTFLDVHSSSKRLFDNPDDAHSKCSRMIKKKSDKMRRGN